MASTWPSAAVVVEGRWCLRQFLHQRRPFGSFLREHGGSDSAIGVAVRAHPAPSSTNISIYLAGYLLVSRKAHSNERLGDRRERPGYPAASSSGERKGAATRGEIHPKNERLSNKTDTCLSLTVIRFGSWRDQEIGTPYLPCARR